MLLVGPDPHRKTNRRRPSCKGQRQAKEGEHCSDRGPTVLSISLLSIYSYHALTMFLLCSLIVLSLCAHSTLTVLSLYSQCAFTMLRLYSHCVYTVHLILYLAHFENKRTSYSVLTSCYVLTEGDHCTFSLTIVSVTVQ